jgi:hypothetical protein
MSSCMYVPSHAESTTICHSLSSCVFNVARCAFYWKNSKDHMKFLKIKKYVWTEYYQNFKHETFQNIDKNETFGK